MDLAGFCDKNIIVSDEALHCGGGGLALFC